MNSVLEPFLFTLTTLRGCIDRVRFFDMSSGGRPSVATSAVAGRLKAGLRFLQAFARRLLVLMALALEPTLVDSRKPLGRPRWRKSSGSKQQGLVIFKPNFTHRSENHLAAMAQDEDAQPKQKPIAMDKLYQRLDYLAEIAADPLARAKRLAFHLARCRHGPMLSPDTNMRVPGFWGTEVSATFTAMAFDITQKSRNRPPPLPPPKRLGPTVTVFRD